MNVLPINELQETSEDEENVITKSRNGAKKIQEGNVTRKAAWSNCFWDPVQKPNFSWAKPWIRIEANPSYLDRLNWLRRRL